MQVKHIYLLPGTGADERLFSRLKIAENIPFTILEWLPLKENESFGNYANRMCGLINSNEKFALIGVSLGGIIAVEMAKFCKPHKLVLLSSIKNKNELPPYYRIFKFIPVYNWLTKSILKRFIFLIRPFFGKMDSAEYKVFKDMLLNSDLNFIKWACHNILHWRQDKNPENCIHLHGTADKILPVKFLRNFILVEDGTHYMIIKKAGVISEKIDDFLRT